MVDFLTGCNGLTAVFYVGLVANRFEYEPATVPNQAMVVHPVMGPPLSLSSVLMGHV